MPTRTREEPNDDDHETLDQLTTRPRRSTRACSAPEWYDNPVLEVMLLDNGEPMNYEEAMMFPDSEKWPEAMKSEIRSMYENKLWTLVDFPDDGKPLKWIFKKKTDADGISLPTKLDMLQKVFDKFKGLTTMRLSHP